MKHTTRQIRKANAVARKVRIGQYYTPSRALKTLEIGYAAAKAIGFPGDAKIIKRGLDTVKKAMNG